MSSALSTTLIIDNGLLALIVGLLFVLAVIWLTIWANKGGPR